MAQTVSADLTVTLNVSDVETSNTASTAGDVLALGETAQASYGTSPAVAKSWSSNIALVASTPQTLDLTALTGPRSTTVSFASLRLIYLYVTTTTATYTVVVGNAASNAFTGPLGGTTPTVTVPAGSRVVLENAGSTAWVVDSTHKSLKFDPGSNNVTIRVILVGS